MNKSKNPINSGRTLLGLGQYRLSALVFGAVMVVGMGFVAYKNFVSTDAKLAKVLEEVPAGTEIPAWWYNDHFGASICEKDDCKDDVDLDGDKLTNYQEYYYGSDPRNKDSNDNGLTDGEDVAFGFAPNKPGKVTFEDAASDQNIVGESLVFNEDIKDLIVDMTDLSKVLLPEVSDAELTITKDSNKESFINYMLALDQVSKKYKQSGSQFENLEGALKQQNTTLLRQMSELSLTIADEYRRIPVPSDAVALHKYHISLWRLMPTVLAVPDGSSGEMSEESMNRWYDSVQAMMALNQKIVVEVQKLRSKYQ
jgi:hypothetical protein